MAILNERNANFDKVEYLVEPHPRLMQRPIFVSGDRALVCRPSEKILELL
jgi:arsenate reductase-like glutaredoxin family protein